MEVHKHSRHVLHKKSWLEYALEFVMLFLAVFLGFIAENVREHQVEKNRVYEYAKSFIKDLAADTVQIQLTSYAKQYREQKLDTLIQLLSDSVKIIDDSKIYYYSKFLFRDFGFHTEDATFQEVRNSGSLRYIANKELLEQLKHYYSVSTWVENDYNNFQTRNAFYLDALKLTSQIFNASDYAKLMKDTMVTYDEEILQPNTKTKLVNTDRRLLNQLASYAVLAIEESRDFRGLGDYFIKNRATKIISLLQKEYNIDNIK